MAEHFIANIKMSTIECYKCHIVFAVPTEFRERQLNLCEKGSFWCPNGHEQSYVGKSKIKRLEERLEYEKSCCISAREEANRIERSAIAYKGHITRLKRKVSGNNAAIINND